MKIYIYLLERCDHSPYSDNLDQHQGHVQDVLQWLRKNHLYAFMDKCFFHMDTVEYLRYILSLNSLTMAEDKVKVIQDWPEPRKAKDVQSFLGFANFY